MFDHGERIHKKVPLSDGSPGITEFILDLKDVAEKSKCWVTFYWPTVFAYMSPV